MAMTETIQNEIEKTHKEGSTSLFLRHLVFQIVDEAARAFYKDDYAMKCQQTAGAAKRLLDRLEIESTLIVGATCFAKVGLDGELKGWTGFFGDEYHVWLQTEFHEIVDLSISQLYRHPRTRISELPVPAIWWDQRAGCPPLFSYLIDHAIDRVEFDDTDEQEKYETFVKAVEERCDKTLACASINDVDFSNLLTCLDQLNRWTEEGRLWPTGALKILDLPDHLPAWMRDRQTEIERALNAGKAPKSRLLT